MTARTSGRPIEKSGILQTQVYLEECKAWGTPRQSCANDPTLKQGIKARLENQVEIIEQSKAWGTPRLSTANARPQAGARGPNTEYRIENQVLDTWPTPQARDYKGATGDHNAQGYGQSLADAIKATSTTPATTTPTGTPNNDPST